MSKGSLYGYFESKQELLIALLEDEAAGRLAILEALGNVSTGVVRLQAFAPGDAGAGRGSCTGAGARRSLGLRR